MSFFLGMVSLGSRPLSNSDRRKIEGPITGAPGRVFRFDTPYAAIRKIDLGAFNDEGFASGPAGVAAVAGHPLLPSIAGAAKFPSGRGAASLKQASLTELEELATSARGSWAAIRYAEAPRELTLVSDRMGARPIYWSIDAQVAVFGSTLSSVASVRSDEVRVDLRAVVEEMILGYALGDRTAYESIRRIGASEIVRLSETGFSVRTYAEWPSLADPDPHLDRLAHATYAAFSEAVALRASGCTEAVTFLSGGMDSRAVNALLHAQGLRIHAFTFSPDNRLDGALAASYAGRLGLRHIVRPDLGGANPDFAKSLSQAWSEEMNDPDRKRLRNLLPAWSGDGGSVCGGWVYVTPSISRALRQDRPYEAIKEFLQRYAAAVAPGDVVPEARHWLQTAVPDGIMEELERSKAADPLLRFFHFLLRNDQRRHLDRHHENILVHGVEFWLPFLDTDFLLHTLSAPPDDSMGHGFYSRWFDLLPAHARTVAWQTYPGHRPCPLPLPEDIDSQWVGLTANEREAKVSRTLLLSREALSPAFPSEFFLRRRFLLRFAAHHLGVKDSGGAFEQLHLLNKYRTTAAGVKLPWQNRQSTS